MEPSIPQVNVAAALPQEPEAEAVHPKRVLGFRDLVMFYVVTTLSLRWIAVAASAGPVAPLKRLAMRKKMGIVSVENIATQSTTNQRKSGAAPK